MTRLTHLSSHRLPNAGAAAVALALFVTAGQASAQPASGPAITIGEKESHGARANPTRGRCSSPMPRAALRAPSPVIAAAPSEELEALRHERDALRAENQTLKDTVARLNEQNARRVADQGEVLKAPAHLDARFQSDALVANVSRALKEAGYTQGQVTSIDCSEYPCIVYGEGMGDSTEFDVLTRTTAWEPYRHDSANKFGWHYGAGTTERFAVAVSPRHDGNDPAELSKRLKFRTSQMEVTFPQGPKTKDE